MTTAKQMEANRRNAQSSTGPRTSEGKAVSCMNGLRHGLTARRVVINGEDPEEYETLRLNMQRKYASSNPLATQLVDRLTEQLWRLRRVPLLENALLSWLQRAELIKDQQVPFASPTRLPPMHAKTRATRPSQLDPALGRPEFDDLNSLGRTVQKALEDQAYLLKLSRYQTTLIRDFDRLLAQLFRVLDRERSDRGATTDAPSTR